MKIKKAEIFHLELKNLPRMHPVILRLTTDEGITGVGEVSMSGGVGQSGAAGMLKNMAKTFAIGADPFQTEKLWETMFRNSLWALGGGGATVFGAMSAIDNACWDIRGKALKLPVYQLLGGKTNDNLRVYASHVQGGWGPETKVSVKPEEFAEEAGKAVAEGYNAVKINPVGIDSAGKRSVGLTKILTGEQVRLFYNRVKAVRETIGPDVDLLIDTLCMLSDTTAIQLGRLWEEFNIYYFEEAVNYLNVEMQVNVARSLKIPMAAGEHIYSRWRYRPYFERQALAVIQPDIGNCGGFTEGKKICDYANIYDITVQCHVYGSPIASAVAMQMEAAIPNFIIHEHTTLLLRPAIQEICTTSYQPVKGNFAVPDLPGLGIELNDKFMKDQSCVIVE
ncbi:MAG: mandelate racemase/muconate lactonizing enzyme family protein [Chloroflexota bacterium]